MNQLAVGFFSETNVYSAHSPLFCDYLMPTVSMKIFIHCSRHNPTDIFPSVLQKICWSLKGYHRSTNSREAICLICGYVFALFLHLALYVRLVLIACTAQVSKCWHPPLHSKESCICCLNMVLHMYFICFLFCIIKWPGIFPSQHDLLHSKALQ